MKRWIAVLLSLLMLLTAAGCSEKGAENPAEQTAAAAAETDASEEIPETEARILPDIPADLDFGGHVFTIMNNDYAFAIWSQIDIGADEMNGVQINDAVFIRNTTVSET